MLGKHTVIFHAAVTLAYCYAMPSAAVVYAQEPSINKMCPVMTDEEADPDITVTYKGKTVAFCCDRCVKKFKANPEKYVKRLPQFATAEEEDSQQPDGSTDKPADATEQDEALAQNQNSTINKMCPVMTDEEADPDITVTYKGKTVALCCDRCVKKFKANPEKYVKRLPQFATTAEDMSQQSDDTTNDPAPSAQHADTVVDMPAQNGAIDGGHEHVVDDEDETVPWFGRIHPAIIHFPVACFPLAMIGFFLAVKTKQASFERADVIPLVIGTVGAIAALLTGNIAEEAMRFSKSQHEIVERHHLISKSVMILGIFLTGLRVWRWNRLLGSWRLVYGLGLLIASGLVGYTGFLGGSLVFGPEHLAW